MIRRRTFAWLVAMLLASGVQAQTSNAPTAAQSSAPGPERMALAREMLAKTVGDREATIESMRAPMIGMMERMAGVAQDRAAALVEEVVLPIMREHIDTYLEARAQGYATALTADDLRGAIAFYDSPAGKNLAGAQSQLAQSRLTALVGWMEALKPEMETRMKAAMAAHGWDKK